MKRIIVVVLGLLFIFGCSQGPKTLDEYKKAGEAVLLKGEYETAKKYLGKGLLEKSSDRDMLYFMGMVYQRELRYDSALYYFKRADLLHPNDRELNKEIYKAAYEQQDFDNIIKAIKVLIKTGDSEDKYLAELANLNMQAGNIFVSFLQLRKLWEKGTDDPNIYLVLANLAGQVDSVEFAINVMKKAIEKYGEREEFVSNYAIYLAGNNQLSEAELAFRSLIKKNPNAQAMKLNLANILTMYDSRNKKIEAYHIYKELYEEVGDVFKLDSTVRALKLELKIKD